MKLAISLYRHFSRHTNILTVHMTCVIYSNECIHEKLLNCISYIEAGVGSDFEPLPPPKKNIYIYLIKTGLGFGLGVITVIPYVYFHVTVKTISLAITYFVFYSYSNTQIMYESNLAYGH